MVASRRMVDEGAEGFDQPEFGLDGLSAFVCCFGLVQFGYLGAERFEQCVVFFNPEGDFGGLVPHQLYRHLPQLEFELSLLVELGRRHPPVPSRLVV